MLSTHLKIAWRQLQKNRSFSLINVLGLAFGLAAAMAVLLFIQDEWSYEAFHERADRIVRINLEASFDGNELKLEAVPNATAPFVRRQIPEVEEVVRLFPHKFGETAFIRAGSDDFTASHLYWADSTLFDVFTLRLRPGAAANPLSRTNTAVLSTSAARRFFGDENPVGKTIRVDNAVDLEITGVFEDLPANTHWPMEVVGSFHTIGFGKSGNESWGNASFPTFLLLNPLADPAQVEAKIAEAMPLEIPEERRWFSLHLKPLRDIHLYTSGMTLSKEPYGDIRQVRILVGLATAKSQRRSKEVAVSKTMGASRWDLSRQIYTETGLLALAGIAMSAALLWLALPFFNQIAGKELAASTLLNPWFIGAAILIWLVVTFIAGGYPAFYLTSFTPVEALRQHQMRNTGAAGNIRKGLVIFQFGVSTLLIIGTLVFYYQLNYIRNKKLGYEPEQVVAVHITGAENAQQVETFHQEVKRLSAVVDAAQALGFPGGDAAGRSLKRPGAAPQEQGAQLATCRATPEIFDVLDIDIIAGRPMRKRTEKDSVTEVVLNRSAVEYLGYEPEEAIGRPVEADLPNARIVGVAEDFHFGSLHQEIGFYAYHNGTAEWVKYVLVKLKADRLAGAMKELEKTFSETIPGTAFNYIFLDEHLNTLYNSERRMARVFLIFAGLAILVACLGLFALAAYAAEQRRKEIGIRKVLGATINQLVMLMSREFLQLVLVSIVIAIPLAWWAANRWLENFAYRIQLEWWMFALAAALAIFIAVLTVSYTSIRTALANPVDALRDE
jgi:putative ABC transport system permease protein